MWLLQVRALHKQLQMAERAKKQSEDELKAMSQTYAQLKVCIILFAWSLLDSYCCSGYFHQLKNLGSPLVIYLKILSADFLKCNKNVKISSFTVGFVNVKSKL